jgi:hypothetical protein
LLEALSAGGDECPSKIGSSDHVPPSSVETLLVLERDGDLAAVLVRIKVVGLGEKERLG